MPNCWAVTSAEAPPAASLIVAYRDSKLSFRSTVMVTRLPATVTTAQERSAEADTVSRVLITMEPLPPWGAKTTSLEMISRAGPARYWEPSASFSVWQEKTPSAAIRVSKMLKIFFIRVSSFTRQSFSWKAHREPGSCRYPSSSWTRRPRWNRRSSTRRASRSTCSPPRRRCQRR